MILLIFTGFPFDKTLGRGMEELAGLISLSWVVVRQEDVVIFLELVLELINRGDSMRQFMYDPFLMTEITQVVNVVMVEVIRSTLFQCIQTS